MIETALSGNRNIVYLEIDHPPGYLNFSSTTFKLKNSLHILHTESSPNRGGQEERILQECQWLKKHGHRIHLAVRPGSHLHEAARQDGLAVTEVPFHGSLNPGATLTLWRLCRRHRIDLLHTHSSHDAWAAYPLHLLGWPVVRSRNITLSTVGKGRSFIYRHGCRRVIATAETISRQLQSETGLPSSRIDVVGEAVDLDPFNPGNRGLPFRHRFGIPPEAPLFGIVAMLRGEKGHRDFLEAALLTHEQYPNTRFIVVGEPTPGSRVETQLRKRLAQVFSDGRSPVIMAGFQADIPEVMAALDVLVVPSRAEAQSRVVPQAFAAGRAVIASEVGGLPELVKDGETGLLIPPAKPEALARAMTRLIREPNLRDRLAKRGRTFAERELGLDQLMQKTLEVYRRALAEP